MVGVLVVEMAEAKVRHKVFVNSQEDSVEAQLAETKKWEA